MSSGPLGAVEYGAQISEQDAIQKRRSALDIVVRGLDQQANRKVAQGIEEAVGPAIPDPPHKRAGPHALPHFHHPPKVAESRRSFVLRDDQLKSQEEAMKYFTPELLERFRSQDDQVASVASDEWEKRLKEYEDYLCSVRSQLPSQLRLILERYHLHDAQVLFAASLGETCQINLRLDAPPQNSLLLNYELIHQPSVIQHQGNLSPNLPISWLYDEVEVLHGRSRLFLPQTSFQHSILLTNGLELQIPFRHFNYFQVEKQQVFVSGICSHAVPTAVA
jgi:hypothetical protein